MTLQLTTPANPFVVGEIQDPLVYVFRDGAGGLMDLLNYQAKVTIREEYAAAPSVSLAAATVTDPTGGEVTYTWNGSEYPTPGHYYGEIWVGNGLQRYCSVAFEFWVRAALGSVPSV